MDLLYLVSYIGILLFGAGWYFVKSRTSMTQGLPPKLFTGGFWLSVLAYALSLLLDDGSIFFKLILLLPRDLMLFGLFIMFVNRFVKMPKTLIIGLLVFGGVFKFFWADFMVKSFNSDFEDVKNMFSSTETVKVDPNAEILFDIKDSSDLNKIKKALAKYDPKIHLAFPDLKHPEYSNLEEYYTLNIADDANLTQVMAELKALNMTDWIEQNEMMKLELPRRSDVSQTENRNLTNDPETAKQWGHQQMSVFKLHQLIMDGKLKPAKKAKIAILDTGVDGEHEDLVTNYTSTDKKYDSDKQGHGTHCAGIAGAVSNNAKGIASYAPNNNFVEITSVKVLSDQGWGTQKDILEGIIKASDTGADVISMSLGGPSNGLVQKAYEEVVKYAHKSGAIIVVAAGNSSKNAKDFSPANVKGVITVAAVDENLDIAKFSNYVTDIEMGIAAPGVNIYSTIPNHKYASFNGTSMATPYVAGLLGMMKAVNPDLNAKEAYKTLHDTGKETKDTEKTGMLIQADKVFLKH